MPYVRVFKMKTIGDHLMYLKGEAPPPKRVIDRELIVNTDHISKIEVEYHIPEVGDVDVEDGLDHAEAIKRYKVFVGPEEIVLKSDPNDPVVKIIEDIYKNAVKGKCEKPPEK
jgi:hypothetical protein